MLIQGRALIRAGVLVQGNNNYGTWSRHCFRSFKHSFGVPLPALISGWDVAGCVPGFVSLLSCLFTLSSAICWRISCRAYRKQDDMVKGPSSVSVTWNSTHKPDIPETNGTFVSTLVLHFMVVKATSSYTERKEVQARIWGHTWELHS